MNGGTCKLLSDGTTEKCFCTDFYYGDTCNTPRVVVDCSNTANMMIKVRAYTDIVKIYAINNVATPACVFGSGAIAGEYQTTFDISNTSSLPCGLMQTTDAAGGVTTMVTLIVQHTVTPDILMASDLKFDAKCLVGSSTTPLEQAITGGVTSIDSTLQTLPDGTVPTSEVSPVKMALLYNGVLLTGSVVLGNVIGVRLFIKPDVTFKDMLVHTCSLNNGAVVGTANFDKVDIVDVNGCPIYAMGIVEAAHNRNPSASVDGVSGGIQITVPVKVFKFTKGTGSTVKVVCSIKLCTTATLTACAAPTAATCTNSNGLAGYGRRRRAAEDERELVTSFKVVVQGVDNQGSSGTGSSLTGSSGASTAAATKDCLEDSRTLAIIIVLAVFVVLLLLAVIIVAACAAQRIRRGKGSYYDGSSSQNLAIPRPGYNKP